MRPCRSSTKTTSRSVRSKCRGGVNLVAQLSDDERTRGLISASTGNHGQSIAYAARLFGVRAVICVPEGANPVKVAAIESLGAEILVHGRDFDDARERCEALAREKGFRYIHSGDEPDLIAGVATGTLEIVEDEPATEMIFVPVGGGSGAAGACIVAKAVDPAIRVIGCSRPRRRPPIDRGRRAGSSRTGWRPTSRDSRRAPPSSSRCRSSVATSTISCSSATTRSERRRRRC